MKKKNAILIFFKICFNKENTNYLKKLELKSKRNLLLSSIKNFSIPNLSIRDPFSNKIDSSYSFYNKSEKNPIKFITLSKKLKIKNKNLLLIFIKNKIIQFYKFIL